MLGNARLANQDSGRRSFPWLIEGRKGEWMVTLVFGKALLACNSRILSLAGIGTSMDESSSS